LNYKIRPKSTSLQLILKKAKPLFEKSQISVSFQKGSPERFFIISGLILENPKIETKVSFKSSENKISSNCTCKHWSEDKHCYHAAALFFKISPKRKKQR
jgi:hypothetical protein